MNVLYFVHSSLLQTQPLSSPLSSTNTPESVLRALAVGAKDDQSPGVYLHSFVELLPTHVPYTCTLRHTDSETCTCDIRHWPQPYSLKIGKKFLQQHIRTYNGMYTMTLGHTATLVPHCCSVASSVACVHTHTYLSLAEPALQPEEKEAQ